MKKMLAALALAGSMTMLAVCPAFADGDSLVIAIGEDVATLHPEDYSTTVEVHVENQIYDPLMYYNADGTHEPEGRVAESYEISDDGLDYTFHLQDGVTFHDGNPVTAEDVVFSIELFKASEYQGSQISMLSSVEATDDSTIVCHLDTPYSPFLRAICGTHISEKAYYESDPDGFASNPIGCGPYKFISQTPGTSIELEAYDGYYRGEAAIKNLTFTVNSTPAIGIQTGEIDFADINASDLPMLESAGDAVTIQKVDTSTFCYVAMNTEQEPYNNVLFRQAVNYAINRENIINVCYEGEAEENSNICAKSRFGYSDDQPQYTYDPDKAKELLEEAGIETPIDLGELLVAEKYANVATALQSDLAAVGINVTISQMEFNSYIQNLVNGSFGITCLNMTLEGDTQMLEMAFTTDYIGTANNARYSDADMDELFNQTREENDTEKRAEIFNQIFTKAQDEAIYAVICNPLQLFAYNSTLQVPEIEFEGNFYVYDFSWAA